MPDSNVSALPSVMQKRLQSLQEISETQQRTDTPTELPVAPVVETPSTPSSDTPTGEQISLSREVYNELLAAAERARTADARAEAQAQRNEELAHRLTELENAPKASSTPSTPTPSVPAVDLTVEEPTADELEAYGESRTFISKIVRKEVAGILNKVLPQLEARITEIEATANGAVSTVTRQATSRFKQLVDEKVPNLRQIIGHKHWGDFLQAQDDLSGMTYQQLIQLNVQNERVEALVKIYKQFETKYMAPADIPTGYNGANPSGGAVQTPADPHKQEKLKASDRKKASEDYRKGKITWDQLQEVNKKFEEAEKAGNIDYNA